MIRLKDFYPWSASAPALATSAVTLEGPSHHAWATSTHTTVPWESLVVRAGCALGHYTPALHFILPEAHTCFAPSLCDPRWLWRGLGAQLKSQTFRALAPETCATCAHACQHNPSPVPLAPSQAAKQDKRISSMRGVPCARPRKVDRASGDVVWPLGPTFAKCLALSTHHARFNAPLPRTL